MQEDCSADFCEIENPYTHMTLNLHTTTHHTHHTQTFAKLRTSRSSLFVGCVSGRDSEKFARFQMCYAEGLWCRLLRNWESLGAYCLWCVWLVEILKSSLASECAMQKDCNEDFWEILKVEGHIVWDWCVWLVEFLNSQLAFKCAIHRSVMQLFERFWKVSSLWSVLYKITVVSHKVSHHITTHTKHIWPYSYTPWS